MGPNQSGRQNIAKLHRQEQIGSLPAWIASYPGTEQVNGLSMAQARGREYFMHILMNYSFDTD
jgi:hypothetical protein